MGNTYIRQTETFKEIARNISSELAINYKKQYPEVIFTSEEMEELFYNRIMTPPSEKIKKN